MTGYLTESFKEAIPNRGGGNKFYPYAQTRVRDFSEMTPEEVVEWWID